MLGRQQRTGLPTLPQQIRPFDFFAAAGSRDEAHICFKLYHDRSKIFLPELSPGQAVLLQDPKTSSWTRKGMISEIRPDHLSYTVKVDGRSFIRPRRMLRAIPLESSSPPTQALAQVSPFLP